MVKVISNAGAPDWTPHDWEQYLVTTEQKDANSRAGLPNADGSRSFVFGDGLTHLRGHVAELRAEVNDMEAQLRGPAGAGA